MAANPEFHERADLERLTAYSLSLAELQHAAVVGQPAAPRLLRHEPCGSAALPVVAPTPFKACDEQELVAFTDDLLLVRADAPAAYAPAQREAAWEIDTRGWLYLHFRLEGTSVDAVPGDSGRMVGNGAFMVCASSGPRAFTRQVLSPDWRAVTVAFRPSFAAQNLAVEGVGLPSELRRFRAGDPDVDFFYLSHFTPEIHTAVRSLVQPTVTSGLRSFYLQAKAVELVCLAFEQVGRPAPSTDPALRLTHRDVRALEEVKRLLDREQVPHSLDDLARRVGLNRRKLAVGFKLLFGETVGDYDRDVRLELARRVLESRSSSVAYAASVAGYSDVGSFGKAFRSRFGALPSKSRPSAGKKK